MIGRTFLLGARSCRKRERHYVTFRRQTYIIYCVIIYARQRMKSQVVTEGIRWQVIKAMLDEFPALREKAMEYLLAKHSKR